MLGGMDSVTDGTVTVDGREVSRFDRRQLTAYRRHDVGFVFQFYNLVQNLTACENVELASQICKNPKDAAQTLKLVGLAGKGARFRLSCPAVSSSGLPLPARLPSHPLLLCDEPTGALDYKTGKAIPVCCMIPAKTRA